MVQINLLVVPPVLFDLLLLDHFQCLNKFLYGTK